MTHPLDGRRLVFREPQEVRLWTRATVYKVNAMPAKEGDTAIISYEGEPVGKLVLEKEGERLDHRPTDLVAVTYWDSEVM